MGNCGCAKDGQTSHSNFRTVNKRISFQSIIITQKIIYKKFDTQIIQKIANKLSNTPVQMRLIFRASQFGYSCQAFHQAADGVTNTLLIVKTVNKKIFGAFTPCCWRKNSSYKYQVDQKQQSFLFSLQGQKLQQQIQQVNQDQNKRVNDQNIKKQDKGNKKIDKVKQVQKKKIKQNTKQQLSFKFYKIKNKNKAIMNHQQLGPIYGEGHDIMIADKCNKNQNWCNIGCSYQSIYEFGSNKANNKLAGKLKFLIEQYEMWAFTI